MILYVFMLNYIVLQQSIIRIVAICIEILHCTPPDAKVHSTLSTFLKNTDNFTPLLSRFHQKHPGQHQARVRPELRCTLDHGWGWLRVAFMVFIPWAHGQNMVKHGKTWAKPWAKHGKTHVFSGKDFLVQKKSIEMNIGQKKTSGRLNQGGFDGV